MSSVLKLTLATALGAAVLTFGASDRTAIAGEYPDKTVRAIVPFGAGGGTDRWVRVISSVGRLRHAFKIPEAPLVITFLLAPPAEENLRRGLLINEGDWLTTLFHSPLAIGLAIGVVVLTYVSARMRIMERVAQTADDADAD